MSLTLEKNMFPVPEQTLDISDAGIMLYWSQQKCIAYSLTYYLDEG